MTYAISYSRMTRRSLLAAATLPWIASCSTPLPLDKRPSRPEGDPAAAARLRQSAEAHGLAAYRKITDINVSYDGQWQPFIDKIQPEIVDVGFRGRSQERLLPHTGVVAQSYRGPLGHKQVFWRRGDGAADGPGEVAVWRNGERSPDSVTQQAAALVAEAYGLFLLGPLWLAGRDVPVESAGTGRVNGRPCDVIDVWLSPGLGRVAKDRIALYIDQGNSVMRRVRFTLEGFEGTSGAVAEVDTFDHQRRFGVLWPMRSTELVIHPITLPAHDWRVMGLDVNRNYGIREIFGPSFTGTAAAPARPVEPAA